MIHHNHRRAALLLCLLLTSTAPVVIAQSNVYVPDQFPIGSSVSSYFFNASGFCGTCIEGSYGTRIPASLLDPQNPNIRDLAFASPGSGTWIGTDIQVYLGHLPPTLPPSGLEFPGPWGSGSLLNSVKVYDSSSSGPLNWVFTPMAWSFMGLGGSTFDWDGVHDVFLLITFGNSSNMNWVQQGGLGFYDSLTSVPESWYSGGYQVSNAFGVSGGGLKLALEVGPAVGDWQASTAQASLTLDGVAGTSAFPIVTTMCQNQAVALGLSGAPSLGWDLAVSTRPPAPASGGGLVTPSGQKVNVDFSDPSLVLIGGLSFAAPLTPQTWSVAPSTALEISAQLVNLDPASVEGFTLSGAVSIETTSAPVIAGPAVDEARTTVWLQDSLWCGPTSVTFAGTSYTTIDVYANGYITFGSPQWSDPSPSATEFANYPRLAGWWSDLDPGANGSIEITHANDIILITWTQVPEQAFPTHAASMSIELDTAVGSCTIRHANIPNNWFRSSLVGLSPGQNATDPGPSLFDLGLGSGTVTGPGATAMAYDLFPGGAPPLFSGITFLFSDASYYVVF